MSPRRRSPRPLSTALQGIRAAWEPTSALGRAQTAWDQISHVWAEVMGENGSYIVERSRVVSLKAGVLTVSCSEAVVAETLNLESADVLTRLNAKYGGEPITRLRCVTGS